MCLRSSSSSSSRALTTSPIETMPTRRRPRRPARAAPGGRSSSWARSCTLASRPAGVHLGGHDAGDRLGQQPGAVLVQPAGDVPLGDDALDPARRRRRRRARRSRARRAARGRRGRSPPPAMVATSPPLCRSSWLICTADHSSPGRGTAVRCAECAPRARGINGPGSGAWRGLAPGGSAYRRGVRAGSGRRSCSGSGTPTAAGSPATCRLGAGRHHRPHLDRGGTCPRRRPAAAARSSLCLVVVPVPLGYRLSAAFGGLFLGADRSRWPT